MENQKKDRYDITELFVAKADKDRCYFGIIKRWKDIDGNRLVFSQIVMPDGFIWAQADDQKELSVNLNELCKMVLDNGLHQDAGVTTKIFEMDFFLN